MAKIETERQGFTVTSSTCKHYFGFVGQRPKGTAIPEECLTCERVMDCMASKAEKEAGMPKIKLQVVASEQTNEPEELDHKNEQMPIVVEVETKPSEALTKPPVKASDNCFIVEDAGVLYSQWSGTVLISKETLQRWGKKVKEAVVESDNGDWIRLKVHALEELENGVVQLPLKVQANIGAHKGSVVKVKPLGVSDDSPFNRLRKTAANLLLRVE